MVDARRARPDRHGGASRTMRHSPRSEKDRAYQEERVFAFLEARQGLAAYVAARLPIGEYCDLTRRFIDIAPLARPLRPRSVLPVPFPSALACRRRLAIYRSAARAFAGRPSNSQLAPGPLNSSHLHCAPPAPPITRARGPSPRASSRPRGDRRAWRCSQGLTCRAPPRNSTSS